MRQSAGKEASGGPGNKDRTMQYQNDEKDHRDEGLLRNEEEQLELSAAWRALLGLESLAPVVDRATDAHGQPAADAPVLENDPWSALLRTQGIQVIDLQRLHIRSMPPSFNERDVELALNNIQEQQP
jgi:hypothetical protein